MPSRRRQNITAATETETNIKLIFSNELPEGLNPNSVLTPKEMQKYFNYSVRTLGNYRTYYEEDQEVRVGPKWIRRGIKGIAYIVKDVIRSHEGLPWSEPYPATFSSVKRKK